MNVFEYIANMKMFSPSYINVCLIYDAVHWGSVVQSCVSTNPRLKFNPLFKCLYIYTSVSFKTLGPKQLLIQTRNKLHGQFRLNFILGLS